jgi:hypothetical protein
MVNFFRCEGCKQQRLQNHCKNRSSVSTLPNQQGERKKSGEFRLNKCVDKSEMVGYILNIEDEICHGTGRNL